MIEIVCQRVINTVGKADNAETILESHSPTPMVKGAIKIECSKSKFLVKYTLYQLLC